MVKLKLYKVNEPRSVIDLLVVVVDFDTVKNATLFVTTIGRIVILNQLFCSFDENRSSLNLVNFSSTYDKSRRLNQLTESLFELIEESNEKTIADGGFGFEDRLKSFLTKTNNHTTAFPQFLKSITDENQTELIKKACKLKQVEIESLITFTSSRGGRKNWSFP